MTREEAAKIIDPETSSEAYWGREDSGTADGIMRWEKDVYEACAVAADALRNRGGQQDSWISVRDRLPEALEPVLAFDGDEDYPVGICHMGKSGIWYSNMRYGMGVITHWMPLPEPPEEVAP